MSIKFELLNNTDQGSIGTQMIGNLYVKRHILVSMFGEPTISRDTERTQFEWRLRLTDPLNNETHVVTIYDWCVPGATNDNFDDWYIGGHSLEGGYILRELIFTHTS